jgi:hypothetical protein
MYCKGCDRVEELDALSRYGHGSICSDCGVREAVEGNFIALVVDYSVPSLG